jgi:hypothetical protein
MIDPATPAVLAITKNNAIGTLPYDEAPLARWLQNLTG